MIMNYNLKENMRFYFVFKIITIVFLIWVYHPYDYKCDFDRTLEKKSKHDSIIDIGFNRLLSQYEYKKQLNYTSLSKNLPSHSKFKDIKNEKNISTYGHLKKGKVSELDAYKREYKKRYGKKKGLAKLDCYYEKKIFDKIEHVYDLAEKFVDDKKSYKKVIYRKYGKVLITFALLPLLGLVIPVFFSKLNPFIKNWCLSDCRYKHDGSGSSGNPSFDDTPVQARATHDAKAGVFMAYIDRNTCNIIIAVNSVITYLLIILFLFVVIYILIKVIKYEKLKSCKGKMSVKEHYRFCKNLLI